MRCVRRCSSTLPEARADCLAERSVGHQVSLVVNSDLQLWQRALGRAEDDLAVPCHVDGGLVTRAQQVVCLLLVQAYRAAHVRADLGVRDDALKTPVALLGDLDEL